MSTFTFIDFRQILKTWLSDDYIHTGRFDDRGNFTFFAFGELKGKIFSFK